MRMKGQIRKWLTGVLSLAVCAGVFAGCGGNGNSVDNSEQEALRQQIAELQKENDALDAETERLQVENEKLSEEKEELEAIKIIASSFTYSLREAYEKSVLDEYALMCIAYYDLGSVQRAEGEDVVPVDFVPPSEQAPAEFGEETERFIKSAIYENNREVFEEGGGCTSKEEALQTIEIVKNLGEYNESYVVAVKIDFILVGASVSPYFIGDILFINGGTGEFYVVLSPVKV